MLKKAVAMIALLVAGCGPSPSYVAKMEYNREAQKAGLPIIIDNISVSSPNSAGGIDLDVDVTNTSSKTIKYLSITAQAYNAVGDAVRGDISRSSFFKGLDTGPYAPNETTASGTWSNAWYGYSIRCARVTRIKITYMDNSIRSFPNTSSIAKLLRPGVSNSCSVQ